MCRGVQKSFRRVKISNFPLYQSRNFWSLNLLKLLNVWYSSRLSLFYQSTSTTPPHQSLILTFLLLEQLLSLQCLVAFFGIIAPFLLLLPVWGGFLEGGKCQGLYFVYAEEDYSAVYTIPMKNIINNFHSAG